MTILDIKLEAQEWNTIIEILCRSVGFSYVQTAPLIDKVGRQMQERVEGRGLKEVG
jgi:hypothetical protein